MAKKKAAPTKKAAPKKREVNKTQEVKAYLAKHPSAGPTEVSTALGKRGIDVPPNYVSTIKSQSGKGGKKKAKRKGRAAAATGGELSTKLADAIETVKAAGGLDEAQKALQTIKRLEG